MSKVLDKIHGVSKYDSNKAFNIYSSTITKKGLIYYEDNPSFYVETNNPDGPLYIEVPLRVYGGNGGRLVDGVIMFKFIEPLVLPNPNTKTYIPKLASSVMEVIIKYNGKTYDYPVQLRNFEPVWLSVAIKNSRMGD